MNIQMIPLTKIAPSPANVRKTGNKTGIEELAASIAAHGLLQNLQVRPAKGGSFEVVAGGRRLAALKLLAKQKKIAADYPVPCHALDIEDATEISLAENEMREAMHPADQFEAFKKLAEDGKGPEEIAARFGTTPKIVNQRLKLAVVSPKLIAAYRKADMTLDCLMAFTVSDDHKQQEKVWAERPKWGIDAEHIRDALTEKHIAADSKLAQFVGVKAYEKAGGAVLRDLFDADNAGWLTDLALVNKLASDKLEQAAETVRGEGWKWVEIIPDLAWESTKGFAKAEPSRTPPTAKQQKQIDKLTAEGNALIDDPRIKSGDGEEPQDDTAADRLYEVQERIIELSEGEATWPDDTKANAGAVIGIDHHGTLEIRRGLIRPEDKAAAKKAEKQKHGGGDTGERNESPTPGLSAKLVEDLTAHRTAALQAMLADNPKIALVAVVHALALGVFYAGARGDSVLRINPVVVCPDRSAEAIETSKAHKQLEAATKAIRKRLPKDPGKLWVWLTGQDQKTLLAILAVCAGHTVDTVEKKRGSCEAPPSMHHAAELDAALKLDMTDYWQPNAGSYFGQVPKGLILAAVAEGAGQPAADKIAALKKDAMADKAAELLSGKGWLPAILRAA
jgi:ParB family transcriptional regulator, chromosome partitioning protein